MKTLYTTLAIMVFLLAVIVTGCEKENLPPKCKIVTPVNNSTIEKGSVVTISVEASDTDGNISEVQFFINNVGILSVQSFPYNLSWNTGEEESGVYSVKAIAFDNQGLEASDEITIVIEVNIPEVTTNDITIISESSAMCGGSVSSDGGETVTARGVCWNTSQIPTIMDNHTTDGSGIGSFSSSIIGLTPNTIYYVRAYAINAVGTGYGEEISFKSMGPITDYDGNIYNIIKIGNEWWMADNLKTTHFSNGDIIPDGTGAGDITEEIEPLYWFAYNNDLNNIPTYGRLYTWHTLNDTRNICPEGWYVPSDDEWKDLELSIGMTQLEVDGINYRGNDGGKLKEIGTTHWNSPNTGATNESGFTALPGGRTQRDGQYFEINRYGFWWTSTESESEKAWIRLIAFDGNGINRYRLYNKNYGFSVRCIKD